MRQPRRRAAAWSICAVGERRVTGRRLPIVIAVVAMLVMSGCTTAEFSSTFTAEGSATHALAVVFNRAAILETDMRLLERQIQAAEERAQSDGYTTERIDSPTHIGIRITGTTRDLVDTGAALNGLYNSLAREASGPIAPFVGTFDRESTAIGGTSFVLDLTANGDLLFRSIQAMGPGNVELESPEGVAQIVAFSYSATMPGTIRSTDGELLDSNTVRWTIPVEGSTTMRATSSAGRDTPWGLITVTTIAALAIVVTISAAIAWLLLHRHRRGRASIPLVAPLSAEGAEITATSDPTTVTVQDVSASLARAVEHVLEGSSTSTALASEVEESEKEAELLRGMEPERD